MKQEHKRGLRTCSSKHNHSHPSCCVDAPFYPSFLLPQPAPVKPGAKGAGSSRRSGGFSWIGGRRLRWGNPRDERGSTRVIRGLLRRPVCVAGALCVPHVIKRRASRRRRSRRPVLTRGWQCLGDDPDLRVRSPVSTRTSSKRLRVWSMTARWLRIWRGVLPGRMCAFMRSRPLSWRGPEEMIFL